MNAEKLAERLNELAEWAEANQWETPIDLADVLREAAEKLEERRWIPAKEDEPPMSTTLLLSVRDKQYGLPYTTAGFRGARWHDVFDLPIDPERITH